MRIILGTAAIAAVMLGFATQAEAEGGGQDKVTICHVAGLASDPANYITQTLAWPAVYGEAGHFYENGTPRAGHENDTLGECEPPTETTQPPTTVAEEPVPSTTVVVTTPPATFPNETPPPVPPSTAVRIPAEPTCADQGLYPQGPTGEEECGPEDLCSADGTTTNWGLLPCPTTPAPPAGTGGSLPETGNEVLYTLLIGIGACAAGTPLVRFARRRS